MELIWFNSLNQMRKMEETDPSSSMLRIKYYCTSLIVHVTFRLLEVFSDWVILLVICGSRFARVDRLKGSSSSLRVS